MIRREVCDEHLENTKKTSLISLQVDEWLTALLHSLLVQRVLGQTFRKLVFSGRSLISYHIKILHKISS